MHEVIHQVPPDNKKTSFSGVHPKKVKFVVRSWVCFSSVPHNSVPLNSPPRSRYLTWHASKQTKTHRRKTI